MVDPMGNLPIYGDVRGSVCLLRSESPRGAQQAQRGQPQGSGQTFGGPTLTRQGFGPGQRSSMDGADVESPGEGRTEVDRVFGAAEETHPRDLDRLGRSEI